MENKRRHLKKKDLNSAKFDFLVRFMIIAAENKRFVEYNEVAKVLGVPLEDIRDYAGILGDYCSENKIPFLNSLIVNATSGLPGENFLHGKKDDTKDNWGSYIADCFSKFHLSRDKTKIFKNTKEISKKITCFLNK